MQIDREEKADHSSEQPDSSETTQQPEAPTQGNTESKPLTKPKRSHTAKLAASAASRPRSHSRHSAVTDKGQATTSLEDLSKIAPPIPGLAEATKIAPERKASPLPSPTSEWNSMDSPSFARPGIVISDHPQSPATLIPATDGSSTRPTKGGIAYPFSLKVNGVVGKDANASMLTLDSVGIRTPPAVDEPQAGKEFGVVPPVTTTLMESDVVGGADEKKRPGVERFYTAAPGAGLFSSGVKPAEVEGAEKVARPPVERFETAQEDLNTLAGANEKM